MANISFDTLAFLTAWVDINKLSLESESLTLNLWEGICYLQLTIQFFYIFMVFNGLICRSQAKNVSWNLRSLFLLPTTS
jgi:hypothetical protein